MIDPFAAQAPAADEAQAAPEATTVTSVDQILALPKTGKLEIVTTYKGGNSYDEPWVVIHAGSVEESDALLDQKFADYLAKVKRVAATFSGGGSPKPAPVAAQAAPANPSAPPAGATLPSNGETRSCQHGAMQYRTGVSAKTGKTWQAFMCPTPKGAPDQCAAEWIR